MARKLTPEKKKRYVGLLYDGLHVRKAAAAVGHTYSEICKETNKDEQWRNEIRDALKLSHEEVLVVEKLLLEGGSMGFVEKTEFFKAIRDDNNQYVLDKDGNTIMQKIGENLRYLPPDIHAQEIILKAYKPEVYCDHVTITNKIENPETIKQQLAARLAELDSPKDD